MASVFDVAKFFMHTNDEMTTMKLQKLCYYAQAWSLVWDDVPLFEEDFEAWANGPVCPALFSAHKGKFILQDGDLGTYDKGEFNQDQLETLEAVNRYYADKSPAWLSDLTHNEDPWKLARGKCLPGDRCNSVISKDDMQNYYSSLR